MAAPYAYMTKTFSMNTSREAFPFGYRSQTMLRLMGGRGMASGRLSTSSSSLSWIEAYLGWGKSVALLFFLSRIFSRESLGLLVLQLLKLLLDLLLDLLLQVEEALGDAQLIACLTNDAMSLYPAKPAPAMAIVYASPAH